MFNLYFQFDFINHQFDSYYPIVDHSFTTLLSTINLSTIKTNLSNSTIPNYSIITNLSIINITNLYSIIIDNSNLLYYTLIYYHISISTNNLSILILIKSITTIFNSTQLNSIFISISIHLNNSIIKSIFMSISTHPINLHISISKPISNSLNPLFSYLIPNYNHLYY